MPRVYSSANVPAVAREYDVHAFILQVFDAYRMNALDQVMTKFSPSDVFLYIDLFCEEFGLIAYIKRGARKPWWKVDVRSSKKVVTAKDNDFRIAAGEALAEAYRAFVTYGAPSPTPKTKDKDTISHDVSNLFDIPTESF